MANKKEYTPEEIAAYNERKKAEMEEMFKKIDEGVQDVFKSEKYRDYLKFVSKFTDYSPNNTLLIAMQRPDASLVAPFGKWQKLGRHVNKGEQGIQILAPVTFKTNEVMVMERPVTDEFGNQVYNDDGTEKMETIEKPVTDLAFKAAYVFDVSQTDGKELPTFVSELSGDIDAAKKEAIFTALKKVTGIDIEFENIRGSAKGYCSYAQNRIVIREGMSDAQTLKTAFHETAHKLLHDPKNEIVTAKSPRNEKEVHAESVAFIVAEKLGMDTSEYSFPYIASWSDGKQLEQLKKALQEIQTAAKKISSAIESELLKMQKRDLSMEEKLADEDLNNIQKAEFLIEDCADRGVNFSQEDVEKITDFAGDHEDIMETVKFVSDMEEIQKQRDSYGYDFTYMTPFDTKEAALAAFDKGENVYLLYPDNTEGLAENRTEIENFSGYFGLEKEQKQVERKREDDLVPVSKLVAIEMWHKNLDVFIDGVPAEDVSQIKDAPDGAEISLLEYQYAAELDFDEVPDVSKPARKIIGNTPYEELGEKSELKYYKMNNSHADNLAKQLEADGVKFSGVKKDKMATITINKADIPAYDAALQKVVANYDRESEKTAKKKQSVPTVGKTAENPDIIGNVPYKELGGKGELKYYTNLKSRHADSIAKALDDKGIKFSGKRKGDFTTITINKADISAYEETVKEVIAGYSRTKKAAAPKGNDSVPDKGQEALAKDPNVIGNTPYEELGGKGELKYYTNLKNRHAENIAKALDEKGIKYSGLKKGTVTTITINKADIPEYEAVVSALKEEYSKNKENAAEKPQKVTPQDIATAIDKAVQDNNYKLYHYDLDKAADAVIGQYGAESVSRILAEYVNNHGWDGRISSANTEWEKEFDLPENKYPPVIHTHPAVLDGFIDKTRAKIKELELAPPAQDKDNKLSSDFDGKFLYSSERVELRDDHRGIPETNYYMSSVNRYYVEGAGWLNEAGYDREQKFSGLNATEFYKKVTKINAEYIDNMGVVGQMDMSKDEYTAMTDKTYSPENAAALAAAKANLEKRCAVAGVSLEKPVEYYAVQQTSNRKFEITTMDADGVVSVVKPDIATVAEAKKEMTALFNQKNKDIKCVFMHPQTLEEKAAEIRKSKNISAEKPDFEIYQLKDGENTQKYRFEHFDRLTAAGLKPEFDNYTKVYEGKNDILPTKSSGIGDKLEAVFHRFNIDRPEDFRGHSLSVSDVVVMNNKAYYVDDVGFQPLKKFKPVERTEKQEKSVKPADQKQTAPEPEKPKPAKKNKR